MSEVLIELRKYALTRGGRTVLIVVASLILGLAVVGALVNDGTPVSLVRTLTYPDTLMTFAVPVVVLMMFTAEWSTRDAVQTFLMRPRRGAVLLAKCAAALVVCVLGLVWTTAVALLASAVRAVVVGAAVDATGLGASLAHAALTVAVYGVFAVGIGLLVARTPVALVLYLGAVGVVDTFLALTLGDRSVWLSLAMAVDRLTRSGGVGWAELPSLSTSLGLWIVLPCVLGTLAFLRREAK